MKLPWYFKERRFDNKIEIKVNKLYMAFIFVKVFLKEKVFK